MLYQLFPLHTAHSALLTGKYTYLITGSDEEHAGIDYNSMLPLHIHHFCCTAIQYCSGGSGAWALFPYIPTLLLLLGVREFGEAQNSGVTGMQGFTQGNLP